MKVAVYSSSAEWKQYMEACFRLCEEEIQPLEVDFLTSANSFWSAIRKGKYDVVLIHGMPGMKVSRGSVVNGAKRLWEEMTGDGARYIWRFGNQTVALEEDEIYYIGSFRKAVSIYTVKGQYRVSTSMKREEERFRGKEFVRIHRNCLVNLRHVKEVEGTWLKLDNGKRLQVRTRRRRQVREAFLNYGKGEIRERRKK